MGLSWQQGPLAQRSVGQFLIPDPLPERMLYAEPLRHRVAFAWQPMDAFYEEDERITGHAADLYHRIDIRRASRHLVVRERTFCTYNGLASYVFLDGRQLAVEQGQSVVPHGIDRGFDVDEVLTRA